MNSIPNCYANYLTPVNYSTINFKARFLVQQPVLKGKANVQRPLQYIKFCYTSNWSHASIFLFPIFYRNLLNYRQEKWFGQFQYNCPEKRYVVFAQTIWHNEPFTVWRFYINFDIILSLYQHIKSNLYYWYWSLMNSFK